MSILNKTQNKDGAKIALARNIRIFRIVGLTLLVVVVAILFGGNNKKYIKTQIENSYFFLEVAQTQAEKQQGLSGRNSMQKNHGMIFVYDDSDRRCMWMKEMRFAIDIIWLDENKHITHVEDNVNPDTFPRSFCGKTPAKYVIELNGEDVDLSELNVGAKIDFNNQ